MPNAGFPLSENVSSLLEWNLYNAIIAVPIQITWIMFLLFNMASIGMFFFQRNFRTIFLVLLIVSLVITPLQSISVMTALDASMMYYISIIDGFILAIAYYSRLSDKFV